MTTRVSLTAHCGRGRRGARVRTRVSLTAHFGRGAGRRTREDTGLLCGEARCTLWQHKMSVAARQDLCGGMKQGNHKGGAAAEGGRPPFVEAAEGRLPCSLPPHRSCLATTTLPQRTSRLATQEIRRASQDVEVIKTPNPPDCPLGEGY